MSDADLRAILEEIRDGAREGRGWRERAEAQLVETGKVLVALSGQILELEKIVTIQFDNGRSRFGSLDSRIAAMEQTALRSSGAAVDVNISQGNQTVGAEAAPPRAPASSGSGKAVVAVGGGGGLGGFLVWLTTGGGWETLGALWKRLTGG